jgi:hypothetical protein
VFNQGHRSRMRLVIELRKSERSQFPNSEFMIRIVACPLDDVPGIAMLVDGLVSGVKTTKISAR